MSSTDVAPSDRPRSRYGTFVLLTVAVAAAAAVAWHQSRPIVLVGRAWPAADRVMLGSVSHQTWDDLLRRYVDADGLVDYAGWQQSADDMERIDEYLAALSRVDESRGAATPQRLVFWINAYNAVTVRGILREYPTTSIQNHVAHLWGYNIWRDLKLIVGDRCYSLGQMEHSVLRTMNEPRIHFAIVCASLGCPRLLNEAYTVDRLDEQLRQNTLAFFADPTKCRVERSRNELQLSPILLWYAADFGQMESDLLQCIAAWLPEDSQAAVRSNGLRVVYLDYDWNLNEQTTTGPPLPPF